VLENSGIHFGNSASLLAGTAVPDELPLAPATVAVAAALLEFSSTESLEAGFTETPASEASSLLATTSSATGEAAGGIGEAVELRDTQRANFDAFTALD
jgi:hypothetical protein